MLIRKSSLLALLFAAFFVFSPASVSAKDEWLQVRSKNFFLIGNASEKDIRKVATKLEQFRETFRIVFGNVNLSASVPTNVVVFKSRSSYNPFKPKRENGKIDTDVAGFFQPGDDVNYITVSTEGTDADMFGTIFHEYVHFILDTTFGKTEVPPWFNEGLAEYYQTFEIEEDQKVKLGMHQDNHILVLRQSKLIPLATFFNISNHALLQNGSHSKTIFYAQAWALIHYLTLNGKTAGLKKFLSLAMANKPAEAAFREAFGIGYPEMEKELRKYVGQGSFKYMVVPLKAKLVFDAEIQTAPLTDAESNAYLGDLLYHIHRVDDSEPFLRNALALQPDLSMANTTLGMVKIRQQKYDEAKTFLEKAIAQDQRNHLALYRYAYLLSREGRDEFGYVSTFDPASAVKMRELLKKAIALKPSFTESYELLAFVNLATNEELDESVSLLQRALKYQPGNMRYTMRIAEIYLRQRKFSDAATIADKLARTADDPELRRRSAELANQIRKQQEMFAQYEASRQKYEETRAASGPAVGEPLLVRRKSGEEKPTLEEMASATAGAVMRGINQSLRPLENGESRVIGNIVKINCKGGDVVYTVKSGVETFDLWSKDFRALVLTTFVPENDDADVGCDSNLSTSKLVLTYKPLPNPKTTRRGELIAIEFVPNNFRFIDLNAEPKPPTYVVEEVGPPDSDPVSVEQRRKAITEAIREALRKPEAGEQREIGFIERTECSNKGVFVHIKTATQQFKLANSSPETMYMRAFTADVEGLRLGCGMKQVDIPVVFVFKANSDSKAPASGDLVSLEFVPKGFSLN